MENIRLCSFMEHLELPYIMLPGKLVSETLKLDNQASSKLHIMITIIILIYHTIIHQSIPNFKKVHLYNKPNHNNNSQ